MVVIVFWWKVMNDVSGSLWFIYQRRFHHLVLRSCCGFKASRLDGVIYIFVIAAASKNSFYNVGFKLLSFLRHIFVLEVFFCNCIGFDVEAHCVTVWVKPFIFGIPVGLSIHIFSTLSTRCKTLLCTSLFLDKNNPHLNSISSTLYNSIFSSNWPLFAGFWTVKIFLFSVHDTTGQSSGGFGTHYFPASASLLFSSSSYCWLSVTAISTLVQCYRLVRQSRPWMFLEYHL